MTDGLRVNGRQFEHHLADLAKIGAIEGGGVCRLAFSEADKRGRDYVERRMRELGLTIRIDGIGNLLGIRPGREAGPLVLAGSHVDTVGTGGRYDGAAGVIAALEVVDALNAAAVRTRLPVGVIVFANEEGARFTTDMMGSLVVRGDLSVEAARGKRDRDGISVGEAMDRVGYAGPDTLTGLDIRAYLELHIEQGPILEQTGDTIGVVEAVQGLTWVSLRIRGAAAHAGATPIDMRRDAGLAAARIVQFARDLSSRIDGQRATVGALTLTPNIVNVVAGQADLMVDLRNPDADRLEEARDRLNDFLVQVAAEEQVEIDEAIEAHVPPVRFDPAVVSEVAAAAGALGFRTRRMVSGAGHDAQILASRYPAAMIFVPSRGGVSHNVQEYSSPQALEAGANVLLQAVLSLAGPGE